MSDYIEEKIDNAYIEAVLFSSAKPISLDLLADIFACSIEKMEESLQAFEKDLVDNRRGLRLRRSGAGIELVTSSHCSLYVSKIRKKEDKLSSAALETLSVIAFKQPVTKSEIEEIRGVNSDKVIKQLLSRQLITELGHKDTVGRPTLFGTTDEFLRSVGINSLDALKEEMKDFSFTGIGASDVLTDEITGQAISENNDESHDE